MRDERYDRIVRLSTEHCQAFEREGYEAYMSGKLFHEGPYAKAGDANASDLEYAKGMAWRRGWNDAALSRPELLGKGENNEQ